jgi:3-deoxy-D-manno-octulosonic acid kinase
LQIFDKNVIELQNKELLIDMVIVTKAVDKYVIGSSQTLNDDQLRTCCKLCERQPSSSDAVLGGRKSVTVSHIDGIGSIVIKHYRRGGTMRHLINRRYLKLGTTRCRREFELLNTVRNLPINAPEPIAYVYRGKLFYRAWLITRQIPQAISLAHLATRQVSRAQRVMPSVIEQISILIQHRVVHADLHPGNVVVDKENRVFLVDFDKGYLFSGHSNKLRDRYLNRWQRSVIKHRLPSLLHDMLQAGLTKRFQ